MDVVLTGRGASDALIEQADLVTEMVPVKHPYDRGVSARLGIEY
jgi:cob(I)alamin adenosyltransferase